ncbi:outer membrane protein [uncultured Legionella sp.]|uniref:outer membrane protein n=1 Tax=uncultured Legionella sp. TaxID=210934 RepID=UPI002616BDC3|nr:outer membrane beta-barrel protein [uncultured Legionella sp.]
MIYKEFFRAYCCIVPLTLSSATLFSASLPWHEHLEISGNFGAAKQSMSSSTFIVTETETDNLRQTNNPMIGAFGFGVSYLFPLKEKTKWFSEGRVGLNYRYLSNKLWNNLVEGQIEQYQDPRMANYTYQMSLVNQRLMMDLSLTFWERERASLFVIGGLGYGWNKLHYSDYPNPGIEEGNLTLNTSRTNRFTSEVGVGAFYQCSEQLKISVQYLYSYFGNIATGSYGYLNGDATVIYPAHFKLDTNAVLLGLHLAL